MSKILAQVQILLPSPPEMSRLEKSLCGMVWYGMVWYGMVWYGMVWFGMV